MPLLFCRDVPEPNTHHARVCVYGAGKIAVGGHSYGAFMTAHLLAHSDLFAAGLARSGAYNRTLTPMGFQAEERDYWHAMETYHKLSPFTYALELADKGA